MMGTFLKEEPSSDCHVYRLDTDSAEVNHQEVNRELF